MISSLVLVFLFLLFNFFLLGTGKIHHNQFCQPRPSVVFTNPKKHPYFISLHRCDGSCGFKPPSLYKCAPREESDVKFNTFDPLTYTKGTMVMKNHTSCKSVCATKESDCPKPNVFSNCYCSCPHDSPPAGFQCEQGKSWSRISCKCVCNKIMTCPTRRYFNKNTCSCECKPERKVKCEQEGGVFKYENCGCKRRRGQTYKEKERDFLHNNLPFWICMVFAELVILTLIFEAYLFYKNHGFIYKISKVCHDRCHAGKITTNTVKSDLGMTNSISIENVVDVVDNAS